MDSWEETGKLIEKHKICLRVEGEEKWVAYKQYASTVSFRASTPHEAVRKCAEAVGGGDEPT